MLNNREQLMEVCGTEIKVRGRFVRMARPELDKYERFERPDELLDGVKQSGTPTDLFTFMQIMPDTSPKFSYPMEWDNLAVIKVSTFEHWWTHQIRSFARNRARQAEKKGVTVCEVPFHDRLVQGMWEVYNESSIRQGKPNLHYGKSPEIVRAEEATFLNRSFFIGAFLGSRLIGFAKLVMDKSGTQANLMNIVAMIKHRDKAPTNALIAQSVRSCAERGIGHLVYQNFVCGKRKADSLSQFKAANGFERVDLPRYHVALTPLGHMVLRLGLHHGFIDLLPEGLSAAVRKLRSSWYNRRLQTVGES